MSTLNRSSTSTIGSDAAQSSQNPAYCSKLMTATTADGSTVNEAVHQYIERPKYIIFNRRFDMGNPTPITWMLSDYDVSQTEDGGQRYQFRKDSERKMYDTDYKVVEFHPVSSESGASGEPGADLDDKE